MMPRDERRRLMLLGAAVVAAIAGLVAAAVLPLLAATIGGTAASQGSAAFDAYVLRIARFTLLQAGLSTVLSVALAVPVAVALARRQAFFGRRLLIRLMAVPLGLPQIVAALGLLAILGRQGVLNDALILLGRAEPFSIYGLSGILIAHVFFNLPLAARLFLFAIERQPGEAWAIAAELGLSRRDVFRFVEGPALARVLPGVAGLIFMLCATSFTVVLLLGGGPQATTLEVAIYQALRFDFDPPRAIALALLQIAMTGVILATLGLLGGNAEETPTAGRAPRRHDAVARRGWWLDLAFILPAAAFLVAPLAAILAGGLEADLLRLIREAAVQRAAATSLLVAAASAVISVMMALTLVRARHATAQAPLGERTKAAGRKARLGARPEGRRAIAGQSAHATFGAAASLVLLVPPIVLGAGWFVLLRGVADVFALAPAIVIIVNALMALPFAFRILEPAFETHMARTARLSLSLGMTGWHRFRIVDWPALRPALAAALAFAAALSLGDLGAIALFGSEDFTTLPYLLLARMGSYRTSDAAGLALLLGLVCLALTAAGTRTSASVLERGARRETAR